MSAPVTVSTDRLHRWQAALARLSGTISGVSNALSKHGAFGLECLHEAESEADDLRKEMADLLWSNVLDRPGAEL